MTSRKAVVIGAGIGGMSVAARLTNQGFSVEVYEQAAGYGGKLRRYRRDGFAFDLGPSLFTLPAVYRDLFLKTGGALEQSVELQAVDPAFRYVFVDGSSVTVPGHGIRRCAAAFGAAFGSESEADWLSLMQRASTMWSLTRQSVLQSPVVGLADVLPGLKTAGAIRAISPFRSLRSLARSYLHDPRMVSIMDRYATYTGSDPRQARAVLATVPYMEEEFGAWHLKGGITALADAIYARCTERGVRFHFNANVDSILTSDGRATGIAVNGEAVTADVVVCNADAEIAYKKLLPAAVGTRGRKRLNKNQQSFSGFCLLLALDGTTHGIEHHNVWFPADYDAEFDALFGRQPQPVTNPAIYACVPADDSMRPSPDTEAWFVLVNAPRHGSIENGGIDWSDDAHNRAYADLILQRLAQRGTDVRSRIRWMEWRTPLDLERDCGAPGGSIYGSSSNGMNSAFRRAMNRSDVPGLYFVGGSAHPGGGLPLVGMSAEIVADLIRADFPRVDIN